MPPERVQEPRALPFAVKLTEPVAPAGRTIAVSASGEPKATDAEATERLMLEAARVTVSEVVPVLRA